MVKQAIIPVAGKGTRFLPATKETAKELIPILNRPMIEYVMDEILDSGIEEVVFVISENKKSVLDYYSRNEGLEKFLLDNGKEDLNDLIKTIGTKVKCTHVFQAEQLGLGHAILSAENVADENFAVVLADDLVINRANPCTKQLLNVYKKYSSPVIGVMEVDQADVSRYGVIAGSLVEDRTYKMTDMVEKPDPKFAPSNLATPGRYIFNKKIFHYLKEIQKGAGNEYQLTDAIKLYAMENDIYAYIFEGRRYDTGNLLGYFEATVDFALEDQSLKTQVQEILKNRVSELL